jgi:alkylation response protein AidB-like acyl-CoA dehydrogenase
MEFELTAQTPAGERFVKLAEELAPFVAERAEEHDRNASFPFEAFMSMQHTGLLRATVPEELGGLGLSSLRDLAAGINRIARGDGSVAFALNLHLATAWVVARFWREAEAAGLNAGRAGEMLERVTKGTLMTSCNVELGTDGRHPLTELVRVPGGWELSGRKAFAPLAAAASVLFVCCREVDPAGVSHSRWVFVPKRATGVDVAEDWDALGLRAAGGHELVFERVFVEDDNVLPPCPWGEEYELSLIGGLTGTLGLLAALLGIAERAHEMAVHTACTRLTPPDDLPLAERPGVQHAIAENEIDLVTCRALIDRAGVLVDQVVGEPLDIPSLRELRAVNAQFQAARLEVGRRALAIVDRSMEVSGLAGYLEAHPLSRLVRDVRVGPLLPPHPSLEVHEYIARVALRLDKVNAT